jgi:hypothetical protein
LLNIVLGLLVFAIFWKHVLIAIAVLILLL